MSKFNKNSEWEKLLHLALPILDDLPSQYVWALGGGTAMFIQINHRVSYDIDIFFEYTGAIREIAKNPKIKEVSQQIQFPGNYLKIERDEGEIDFISAMNVVDNPHIPYKFCNRQIYIEKIEEIIAKKIKFRGSSFTYRDVFDLSSVLLKYDPHILHKLYENEFLKTEIDNVYKKIKTLHESNIDAVINTEEEFILENMFEISLTALQEIANDKSASLKL